MAQIDPCAGKLRHHVDAVDGIVGKVDSAGPKVADWVEYFARDVVA